MKNYRLGKKLIRSETGEKILDYEKTIKHKIFNPHDIVIIDTLGAEKRFLNLLHKSSVKKIISFDELNLEKLKTGVVINGIYFAKKKLKNNFKKISIYQGPKYLVLNQEFEKKKRKLSFKKKLNVLIASGGADNKNFLFRILKKINFKDKKQFNFLVAAGKGVKKSNPIYSLRKYRNIKILENVKNMKKLFDKVHLSIVSGGTVMFESICCGKVTFTCQTYLHQKFAINYFKNKNIIENIGSIDHIQNFFINDYIENLSNIKKNYNNFYLRRLKEIDGLGLKRVNNIIYKYINNE